MRRVALVTYQDLPELDAGDALLVEPLSRRDVTARPVAWDDPHVNWKSFDGVVIRSTWDYHHRPEDFRAWLLRMEKDGVPLWNPVRALRWNMDKVYLRDLHAYGIHTLPTIWVEQGEQHDLQALLEQRNWERAVVKPRVSASAYQTWVLDCADAPAYQDRFATMAQESGVVLQKFASEIHAGEWSFMFFNGIYSHAVLKRPAPESVFVQSELGGTVQHTQPAPALISQAAQILRVARRIVKANLLYARVDAVVTKDELYLMEVELIEPVLFFSTGQPETMERFADAITDRLEAVPAGVG